YDPFDAIVLQICNPDHPRVCTGAVVLDQDSVPITEAPSVEEDRARSRVPFSRTRPSGRSKNLRHSVGIQISQHDLSRIRRAGTVLVAVDRRRVISCRPVIQYDYGTASPGADDDLVGSIRVQIAESNAPDEIRGWVAADYG